MIVAVCVVLLAVFVRVLVLASDCCCVCGVVGSVCKGVGVG